LSSYDSVEPAPVNLLYRAANSALPPKEIGSRNRGSPSRRHRNEAGRRRIDDRGRVVVPFIRDSVHAPRGNQDESKAAIDDEHDAAPFSKGRLVV